MCQEISAGKIAKSGFNRFHLLAAGKNTNHLVDSSILKRIRKLSFSKDTRCC